MSATLWPFRQLSTRELAAHDILAACRRAGLAVSTRRQMEARTQARFSIHAPALSMDVACDAAAWYAAAFPSLQDVPWDVLLNQHGAERFAPHDTVPVFADPLLRTAVVTFTGLDEEPAPTLVDGTSVVLQSDHGQAWVRSIRARPDAQDASRLFSALPVHVDLRLGKLQIALGRLRRLAPGSILLLETLEPRGCVSGRPVFEFTFTRTEISLMSTFDFLDDETDGGSVVDDRMPSVTNARSAPVTARRALDDVPVGVDVILCRLSRTVAELGGLAAGSTMELPDQAWTRVELRANGLTVATGELVQVGGKVGVMLHEGAKSQ